MNNEKLKIPSFKVKEYDDGYEIKMYQSNLAAIISDNDEVTYYITGASSAGIDWLEIDVNKLEKLKNFCKLMMN